MEILKIFIQILIFIGLDILFPLWASNEAKNRGLDKINKFAKISIFFLLGWLGGLIAWIAVKRHPAIPNQSRKKSWVDNLMLALFWTLGGAMVTFLGYTMWQSIQAGTQGAIIFGSIPIPIQVLPAIFLFAGLCLLLAGLAGSLITLYKRFIRGVKTYHK